jgi:hypothetical protein
MVRASESEAPDVLAAHLDLKSRHLIELWMRGSAYPPDVATVRRIADSCLLNDHEIMMAWLCDRDPNGEHFYRAMLEKLSGDVDRATEVMADAEGSAT